MDIARIELIRRLATNYRYAIDRAVANGERFDDLFRHFPRGCCTATSDLLGEYLILNEIRVFDIHGNGPRGVSHAWLITEDGIHVDITGDGVYPSSSKYYYDKKVFVDYVDEFHKTFSTNITVFMPPQGTHGVAQNHIIRKEIINKYLYDLQ